jgi:hypothetical protein
MEGLRIVPRLARRGYYAASLDISDHFMHVGIARDHWKYMVLDLGPPTEGEISVENPRFVYVVVLPMGYTNSPAVIGKVMTGVVRACRERGVRLVTYADDWLVLGATVEETARARAIAVEELQAHGFAVAPNKGVVDPTQEIYHLGLDIDLKRGLFCVPPAKAAKVQREAKGMICSAKQNRRWVKAKWLMQFAGLCISLQLAVPTARFRTRSLFDVLKAHGIYRRGMYTKCRVKLTREALTDLEWWRDLIKNATGHAMWRPATTKTLWTDASKEQFSGGWGGEILGLEGRAGKLVVAHGVWTRQELFRSINFLELKAVRLVLERLARGRWQNRLRGSSILLWEDNQSVMHIINNLTTRSPEMMIELRKLYDLLAKIDVTLRARYIPSAQNPADYWSRIFKDKADWQWRPAVAHRHMHKWGRRTVDLFASRGTALLSRYGSMVPDPGAEFADAFAISWAGEQAWINPPWSKVLQVLAKLEEEPSAEATLLLPHWPSQPWWPMLMKLSDALQVLPLEPADIVPGPGCQISNTVPEPLRNLHWGLVLAHVPAR